jgi:predicted ATPase
MNCQSVPVVIILSGDNLGLLLNLLGLKPPESALDGLDGVLVGLRTRELLYPRVTQLPVEPLSARETARIAQARLGVEQLPEALARLISARAEGNALFAEEIASFLSERGIVRRVVGLDFDQAAVAAALPESVQSLLASRVDRLAPEDRALLQAAAVVGRRFDPDLVAAVAGAGEHTHSSFAAMERLDLIHRVDGSSDYVFKHALVRDGLYNGLLSGPRAALHLKVAENLELRSTHLTEIAEILARHYAESTRNVIGPSTDDRFYESLDFHG